MDCPYCGHELIDLGDGEYWCQPCNILDTTEGFMLVGASGYGIDDGEDDYPRSDVGEWVETMPTKPRLNVSIKFEPRDLWIGVFWTRQGGPAYYILDIYICLLPMLPIRFHFEWLA